jgi:uncharacterized protein YutE (UPF0331/DUF86 family)
MIQENTIAKIGIFQDYLNKLIFYTNLPLEEITNNFEKLSTMERLFILMVDEALDINSAVAYQIGNKIPESSKSTFYEIANLNIITQEFADKISLSAKVRNNLVHNYEEIQKRLMVEEMKKFTDLYKEYIKILTEKFIKV